MRPVINVMIQCSSTGVQVELPVLEYIRLYRELRGPSQPVVVDDFMWGDRQLVQFLTERKITNVVEKALDEES